VLCLNYNMRCKEFLSLPKLDINAQPNYPESYLGSINFDDNQLFFHGLRIGNNTLTSDHLEIIPINPKAQSILGRLLSPIATIFSFIVLSPPKPSPYHQAKEMSGHPTTLTLINYDSSKPYKETPHLYPLHMCPLTKKTS